jgi:hypothetical protein
MEMKLGLRLKEKKTLMVARRQTKKMTLKLTKVAMMMRGILKLTKTVPKMMAAELVEVVMMTVKLAKIPLLMIVTMGIVEWSICVWM